MPKEKWKEPLKKEFASKNLLLFKEKREKMKNLIFVFGIFAWMTSVTFAEAASQFTIIKGGLEFQMTYSGSGTLEDSGSWDIKIFDSEKRQIQSLQLANIETPEPKAYITDVNFDGYPDIFILKRVAGVRANHFYSIWLWNSETKQFENQPELAPNLAIDRENRMLLSVESYTASTRGYQIYQFKDGFFQLTHQLLCRAEVNDQDGESFYFEESDWKNSEKVWEKEWVIDSQNQEESEEVYNRFFGEDSRWKLRDLRWYRSDYGNNLGFTDSEGREILLETNTD